MDSLREKLRFGTVFLGVLQVTIGCLVGMIPPSMFAWYRGMVMSHIEYTANGVLMVVLGILVPQMKLGKKLWLGWFTFLQLGTWTNGTAGLVAAIVGSSSQLLSSLNEKFPPPHGQTHPIVTGLLQVCALTMMAALLITLYGLLCGRNEKKAV